MRLAALAVLLAVIGVSASFLMRGPVEELRILKTGSLPEGTTVLDMGESPTYRVSYQYLLKIRSTAKRSVDLRVRLEDPAPKGMRALLKGETRILREGSAEVTLFLVPPPDLGPFKGTVTLYSEDLPDWTHAYGFSGTIVQKPHSGRHVQADSGVDLGDVRPTQRCPFVFSIRNVGDETLTIEGVRRVSGRIRLEKDLRGQPVVPGGEIQVNGVLIAPKRGGRFEGRVEIACDASNAPRRHVVVFGVVIPDYSASPDRLSIVRVVAPDRPRFKFKVRAREGEAPFTVTDVEGLSPYFEMLGKGGAEPAAEQIVEVRLRRDAPAGKKTPDGYALRFRLSVGEVVDVPVELGILPAIFPEPPELSFGTVARRAAPRKEVRLTSYVRPTRPFEVTSARSESRHFVVEAKHSPGLQWSIWVSLPKGIPPGTYHDTIVIETDDPDSPKISIKVSAVVR